MKKVSISCLLLVLFVFSLCEVGLAETSQADSCICPYMEITGCGSGFI